MKYTDLDEKIQTLESRYESFFDLRGGQFWKEMWGQVKEISVGFKNVRYPSHDAHQCAWIRFQSTVEKMKKDAERHKSKTFKNKETSESTKKEICSIVDSANPDQNVLLDMALTLSGVSTLGWIARNELESAGLLKAKSHLQREKDKLKRYSDFQKRAWNLFGENKDKLTKTDRSYVYNILEKNQQRLDEKWNEWKSLNGQRIEAQKAQWEQRQRQFETKLQQFRSNASDKRRLIREISNMDPTDSNDAEVMKGMMKRWKSIGYAGNDEEESLWQEFCSTKNFYWERRKGQALSKFTSAMDKQESFRDRLLESIEKDKENLQKFLIKREAAWSDSYRSNMDEIIDDIQSRLSSKLDKLNDVTSSIADLERKIRNF